MIEQIKSYLLGFPELEGKCITTDRLGEQPGAVGLFSLPCEPVVRAYTDGGRLMQFEFRLLGRERLADDNSAVASYYKSICDRICEASRQGKLPILDGATAQSMYVTASSALDSSVPSQAVYEIRARLVYSV